MEINNLGKIEKRQKTIKLNWKMNDFFVENFIA